MLRSYISDRFGKDNVSDYLGVGPGLVRLVFHDASDLNNEVFANGSNANWGKTGIDSCEYSPKDDVS